MCGRSPGHTWGQVQKRARGHLPMCRDRSHSPGADLETPSFLRARGFLAPSWHRHGGSLTGRGWGQPCRRPPSGHVLNRQATLGSAASAGSRYTSWGCSRAGVMARWRHSRFTYCTSATSISRVHLLEAFCACLTSMQAHLGRRARWAGAGARPDSSGPRPAPRGAGRTARPLVASWGSATALTAEGPRVSRAKPTPSRLEGRERRDLSGVWRHTSTRASLLYLGSGGPMRGSGLLGVTSRPPGVTRATEHAYFLNLCLFTCTVEPATARPCALSRERTDRVPVMARRGARACKGTARAAGAVVLRPAVPPRGPLRSI